MLRRTVQIIGKDLIHVVQQESETSVRIGISRILLPVIAPHGDIVEGPVRIIKEHLECKIKQIVVHVDCIFKSLLVFRLCQIRIEEIEDFCTFVGIVVTGVVSFDRIGYSQIEDPAHVVSGHTRRHVTVRVELPVEECHTQTGSGKPRKTALIADDLGIFVADTPVVILGNSMCTEADLLKRDRIFRNSCGPDVRPRLLRLLQIACAAVGAPGENTKGKRRIRTSFGR